MITTKSNIAVALVLFLSFFTSYSHSYEVSTHAALTREAYGRSTLQKTELPGKPDLLTRLGVSAYGGDLGNAYLDMTPEGAVFARHNNPGRGGATGDVNFTENKFRDANKRLTDAERDALPMESPAGWMMVGSIREDDFKYNKILRLLEGENPPQDDPSGSIDRIFNHFYDPYRNIPLQATGLSLIAGDEGNKTPEWAIEGKNLKEHRNRFSIKDAKEAMFRAATLRMLEDSQRSYT